MNDSQGSAALRKVILRAYFILIIVLLNLASIILYAFGKLPSLLIEVVVGVEVLIALVVAIRGELIRRPLMLPTCWNEVLLKTILTIGLLVGIIVSLFACLIFLRIGNHLPSTTSSSSNSASNQSQNLAFQQSAPNCNNPGGTLWSTPFPETSLTCTEAGLVIRPTSSHYNAEVLLDQVNNQPYQLDDVSIEVTLTFQNPTNPQTLAGLVLKTSPVSGQAEQGFIFWLNPTGQWQSNFFDSNGFPFDSKGGTVSSNLGEPTTIELKIQSGYLYSYINGQEVNTGGYSNVLRFSEDTMGLLVGSYRNTSSSVTYSDLTLMSINDQSSFQ